MPQIKNLTNGTVQHTAEEYNERYYITDKGDVYPSMTFILDCTLPTPPQLMEWIGNKGYEESRRIMNNSADIGTYVHESIESIIKGGEISADQIDLNFKNPKDALAVKRALVGFLNFVEDEKPEFIETEYHFVAEHNGYRYGGTIDLKCKIKGVVAGVDFKTSNSLYDKHRVQVTGYGQADKSLEKLYLLHIGNGTKSRYTLSEVDSKKHLRQFEICLETFYLNNPNPKPTEENFPKIFKLQ